jgi:hypothetical protein
LPAPQRGQSSQCSEQTNKTKRKNQMNAVKVKQAITAITWLAALLAGCSRKPDARDTKLAELESRIAAIETDFREHTNSSARSVTAALDEVWTNSVRVADFRDLSALFISHLKEQEQFGSEVMKAMSEAITNTAAKRYSKFADPASPVIPATIPTLQGVPLDVYKAIAADASKGWPTDYAMQDYEIKKQIAAYRQLHP